MSGDSSRPYRGLSADAGLHSLLGAISEWRPQHLLVTGDLSEDASPESYQRLSAALSDLKLPVCALPGNHDDDAEMQSWFPRGPWQGPFVIALGNWNLVLIKTSRDKRIDGAVSSADRNVLEKLLSRSETPTLVALHHQPVVTGSRWIDRYMLEDPAPLLKLIESQRLVKAVLWGHVHHEFAHSIGSARLLSCPSTAANSLPNRDRFTLDPAGPACRWFELYDDGRLETGILHSTRAE